MNTKTFVHAMMILSLANLSACTDHIKNKEEIVKEIKEAPHVFEKPEYFNLRPKVEKDYGYTHAVRIGDDIKISGAVSMDDKGMLTARETWTSK